MHPGQQQKMDVSTHLSCFPCVKFKHAFCYVTCGHFPIFTSFSGLDLVSFLGFTSDPSCAFLCIVSHFYLRVAYILMVIALIKRTQTIQHHLLMWYKLCHAIRKQTFTSQCVYELHVSNFTLCFRNAWNFLTNRLLYHDPRWWKML